MTQKTSNMRSSKTFYDFLKELQGEIQIEYKIKPSTFQITASITPIMRKYKADIKKRILELEK